MCPESWQDQYNLTQDSLPQSIRKLLGVLENVEKVVANSNAKEKAMKENRDKATGKHEKGRCKGTSSKDYHIPKKVRVEKSCTLCQKHGGTHMTHNACECCKWSVPKINFVFVMHKHKIVICVCDAQICGPKINFAFCINSTCDSGVHSEITITTNSYPDHALFPLPYLPVSCLSSAT
jgi:hypothetical protein